MRLSLSTLIKEGAAMEERIPRIESTTITSRRVKPETCLFFIATSCHLNVVDATLNDKRAVLSDEWSNGRREYKKAPRGFLVLNTETDS